ncbi:hypothetical protein AAF712_007632 [Marasmius tenuissimus]|uniref:Nephrocystin 3-like N-terminal domain-containing protein n=1 Tax=Marasmius tenuissimus TaxID=585030 RepID=A0ABR2ZVI7_9AGAR
MEFITRGFLKFVGSSYNNYNSGPGTQNNNNATNQYVNYGDHTGPGVVVNSPGHGPLWEAIADVGASHTAEQQYDRGSCLEGTRIELLGRIHRWRQAEGEPLCWLTGTAGVGKTAIAMTVAKACEEEGALVSSFFFFRLDNAIRGTAH